MPFSVVLLGLVRKIAEAEQDGGWGVTKGHYILQAWDGPNSGGMVLTVPRARCRVLRVE